MLSVWTHKIVLSMPCATSENISKRRKAQNRMDSEIDLDLLRSQLIPIQLGAVILRQRPELHEPIAWVDTSTRPDLNRLRPESPSELHVLCSLFHDPDQHAVLLRVDIRPGHLVFALSFPLSPSPLETPMLRLIELTGKLWIAPGPPPADVSPDSLMAHLAAEENRGITITFQTFQGEPMLVKLRALLENETGDN